MKKISMQNAGSAQNPGDVKSNGLVDMFDTLLEFDVPKQGMQYEIISDADDPVRIRTNALTTDGRNIEYTVVPDPTSEYTTSVDQTSYEQYVSTILGPDNKGKMTSKLFKDGLYYSKDIYGPNTIPVNMKYVGDNSTFEKFELDKQATIGTNVINTSKFECESKVLTIPTRSLVRGNVLNSFPNLDTIEYYDDSQANLALFIDKFNNDGGYYTMARPKRFEQGIFISLTPMYLYFGDNLSLLPDRIKNAAIEIEDIYKYEYQNSNTVNRKPIIANVNSVHFPTNVWLIPTGPTYFLRTDDYTDMFNDLTNRQHLLYLPEKDGSPNGEVEFIMRTTNALLQYDPRVGNGQIPYYPTSIDTHEYFSYQASSGTRVLRATSYWLNNHTILNGIIYQADSYDIFGSQAPRTYEYHEGTLSKIGNYTTIFHHPVVEWLSNTFTIVRPLGYSQSDRRLPIGYSDQYIEYTGTDSYTFKFNHKKWADELWIYTYQANHGSNFGTNAKSDMYDWTDDGNDTKFKSLVDYYGYKSYNDRYYNWPIRDANGTQPATAWSRMFTPNPNSSVSSIKQYQIGVWGTIGISSTLPWNALLHNVSSWRLNGTASSSKFVNFNISTFGDKLRSIKEMQDYNYEDTRVAVMPSPFYQKLDDVKYTLSYQRKYDPNEQMAVIPINASNAHYSKHLNTNEPVIFTSDVIEESINQYTGKLYSEDFLFSTFLSKDDVLVNTLIQNYNKVDPVQIVDQITSKYDEEAKKDPSIAGGLASVKSTITDLYSPNTPMLSPVFKDFYDQTGRRIVVDPEKYYNYRAIIAANAANEGIFGLAGHVRILMTNYDESPIYNELLENGFHEKEIRLYSRLAMSLLSSMYGIDLPNMLDSVDIANEVTLINSLVSNQLSTTYSLMDKIGSLLTDSSKFDPQNQDHQRAVSDFANISNQVANDLLTTIGEFDKMMSLENLPTASYNYQLLSRNVKNTTSYAKSLSDALRSDPYIALSQHSAYIKERLGGMSIKTGLIDSTLNGMDFIAELPQVILEGMESIKDIAKTIVKFAANTIGSTFKLIDNVDKLIFINETYLSKGIIEYSSIPTLFDDVITPPEVDNGVNSEYHKYHKKAELIVEADTGFLNHLVSTLNLTKNDPIKVGDHNFSYNDYNVGNLISTLSGYYYPKGGDGDLPILIPDGTSTRIVPNLSNYMPVYPEKGNLLKLFLHQLGHIEGDTPIDKLSPYMPISDKIVGVYTGSLVGIIGGSAIAGAAGGGFTDPISALVGAIGALFGAATTNAMEMTNVIYRRGVTKSDENSVYGFALKHFDTTYKQLWANKITANNQSILWDDYVFIMSDEYKPLFSESSNFKKTILLFKEVIATIFNTIAMISVSYMIGKVAKVLVESGRKINDRLQETRKRRFENKKVMEEADAVDKSYEKELSDLDAQHKKNIDDTKNDPDLSEKEKRDLIKAFNNDYNREHSRLTSERKEFALAAKAKVKLNSTQYWRLSKELALKYDVPTVATSRTGSKLGILAGIGSLTASAISTLTDGFKKFISKLDPEDQEDVTSPPGLDGIVDLTSEIAKRILAMSDDIKIIKKYI